MFDTGKVFARPGLLRLCEVEGINPLDVVARHVRRDWSEMCAEDQLANGRAITEESRIFSAYTYAGEKVFVITEADRRSTTLLLADEY